jgi:hypothetical protein
MRVWKPVLGCGLLICLACMVDGELGLVALADEPTPKQSAGKTAKVGPAGLTSKVFTLKTGDLEVLEELIRSLLEPVEGADVGSSQGSTGGFGGGGLGGLGGGITGIGGGGLTGLGGGLGGQLGIGGGGIGGGIAGMYGVGGINGGVAGIAGGALGNQPGIRGGIAGQLGIAGIGGGALGIAGVGGGALGLLGSSAGGGHMPAASTARWRLAIDERTRSLIFRGTPEDLQTVGEIVALAELPANKPLPSLHRVRAFRLEHANAVDLVEKLNQLEMEVRLASLDNSKIIVAIGSESAKKEIAELIKALDIEVKAK